MTHYPADWGQTPATSSPAARQEEWLALESIYYSGTLIDEAARADSLLLTPNMDNYHRRGSLHWSQPLLQPTSRRCDGCGHRCAICEPGTEKVLDITLSTILETKDLMVPTNQVEYHVGGGDVDHVMAKCAEIG